MKSPRRPTNICLMSEVIVQKDVMVIAEQPTSGDDAYGRLFVGRGLKEIKAYLAEQGIDAHFTYALKCCKPDRDTKPRDRDFKACRVEYLSKELEAVKPKHIIVLGSNALKAAIGHAKKLTGVQGTRFKDEKSGAWIYPTLHFAQALYSEENRAMMWSELKLFVKWIKGGEAEIAKFDPPVYIVDTIKGLKKMVQLIEEAGNIVGVDTETMNLEPRVSGKHVRTIQFCWDPTFGGVVVPLVLGDGCYYTDPKNLAAPFWAKEGELLEVIEILRELLAKAKIIWHGGTFDRKWLWFWGKRMTGRPIKCPNILMDTMHAAYLLNENRRLKLKALITAELGFPSYDIPDKMTKDLDLLFPYGARDTVGMFLLYQKYDEQLRNDPDLAKLGKFYRTVMRRADVLYTKMEIRGWPVDLETAICVEANLLQAQMLAEQAMHKVLSEHNIEVDSKVFASFPKLSKLIWEDLGLMPNPDPSIAYTDPKLKESLSTDEDALIHIKHHPFVAKLLEWRSLTKALSTYAAPMREAAETRGVLTTVYKLAKTKTGRTASGKEEGTGSAAKTVEGMNLQNIPGDKPGAIYGIKTIVRCPDPDEWIMEADFGQIELRIAGELSKDPTLLWAYQNDVDLHTFRAKRIKGVDNEGWELLAEETRKDARWKAKPVNFGYLYGMSWFKFRQYALVQYGVQFSSEEAKKSREDFFNDHRGLEQWYGKQERMAQRLGYVETLSGRRRRLLDILLDPESSKDAQRKYKEAVRQAINSPVQGFASDLKMMAAIEIDMILDRSKAKLIGEVHDSILLRVKKAAILEVANIILPVMRHPKLLDVLGIELSVPIDAEIEVGPSWGEKKEISKWPELCVA